MLHKDKHSPLEKKAPWLLSLTSKSKNHLFSLYRYYHSSFPLNSRTYGEILFFCLAPMDFCCELVFHGLIYN